MKENCPVNIRYLVLEATMKIQIKTLTRYISHLSDWQNSKNYNNHTKLEIIC